MPDPIERERRLRAGALDKVATVISEWGGRALTSAELAAYPARTPTDGWRIEVTFSDEVVRRLDVIVVPTFPRSAPRIALVDRPPFLTWPHLERDGVLCLFSGSSEVSPYVADQVVRRCVGNACDLIEAAMAGRLDGDFLAEFASYWDWARTEGAVTFRSLVAPGPPCREVRVWRGRSTYLMGETDEQIARWRKRVAGSASTVDDTFEPAVFAWLDQLPLPADYPGSGGALRDLLPVEAQDMMKALAAQEHDRVVVVIAGETGNGIGLGGVTLRRATGVTRGGGARPTRSSAGFRPGHTPPALAAARYLSSATVMRSNVDRIDGAWMHGRGQDPRQAVLAGARVTVLGCGSVGAPVAIALAQAGVGDLRLVDPDLLVGANPGRHPLGAKQIGSAKAEELAVQLAERLPHLCVQGYGCFWEDLPHGFDLFGDSDLIVSAMGDWESEGALNAAHLAAGRCTPIVYGWTEAHACAGHAVVVRSSGGCLQCGLDHHGGLRQPATVWPGGGLRQEPACGAEFQPYGPVELGYIVSMIAETSLDMILESGDLQWRSWVSAERRLKALGGEYAEGWTFRPPAGGLVEFSWPTDGSCPACGGARDR